MLKVLFDHDSAAQQDLSAYILDISPISRRVESEKPGEAGLIVFDNLSLEIPLSAFAGDEFSFANLDANGDYIFDIRYTLGGTEYNLFVGICDKSTVEHTKAGTVRFDILDKLSALILAESSNARQTMDAFDRFTAENANINYVLIEPISYDAGTNRTTVTIKAYNSGDGQETITNAHFYNGEILEQTTDPDNRFYFRENNTDDGTLWYKESKIHGNMTGRAAIRLSATEGVTYGRYFYGEYIHYPNGTYDAITSFEALDIISALVHLTLVNTPIINNTGQSHVEMNLDYYDDTIFDEPFGRHPLDALIFLAQSLRIYMYIDTNGTFVMQDNFFGDTSVDIDLGDRDFIDKSIKYQWDKRVDYVLIKSATNYDAENETTWGEYPQDMTKKPRVTMEKETFLLKETDSYENYAHEYYDFYSSRRESMQVKLPLDPTTITIDLTKKLSLNNGDDIKTYFVENMSVDIKSMTIDLNVVEL